MEPVSALVHVTLGVIGGIAWSFFSPALRRLRRLLRRKHHPERDVYRGTIRWQGGPSSIPPGWRLVNERDVYRGTDFAKWAQMNRANEWSRTGNGPEYAAEWIITRDDGDEERT